MIRRPRRTVPATLAGLVLLVVAVLLAISCVQLVAGLPSLVSFAAVGRFASGVALRDPVVLGAGGALVLVGLVLLGCALLPGTPRVLALATGNDHTDAGVARHSLARDLTAHARRADGITDARVTVGARRVTVAARTALRDRSGLAERVRALVDNRLADVNLARPTRVRVRVTPDRSTR